MRKRSTRAQGAGANWYPSIGVNLTGGEYGGTFPSSLGAGQYNYPIPSDLDYLKTHYLKIIRVGFRWERVQPTLGAVLRPEDMSMIDAIVNGAAARGLQVMLGMLNFGGYGSPYNAANKIGGGTITYANYNDVWVKLATRYAGNPGIYGYGIMGEPAGMPFGAWPIAAQSCINAIRTVDTKTPIIVSGDNFSGCAMWTLAPVNTGGIASGGGNSNFGTLRDALGNNNIMYEAHCYWDSDFSGGFGLAFTADGATSMTGANRLNSFAGWCQTNQVRGIIGEFGWPSNDAGWLPCATNFFKAVNAAKMPALAWNIGAGGGWTSPWSLTQGSGAAAVNMTPGTVDAPQISMIDQYAKITGQAPA